MGYRSRGTALSLLVLGASVVLAAPYCVPDAELLDTGFGQLANFSTSNSTLDGKADLPGQGVSFQVTLSGSDGGRLGLGDPWPTSSAAGLAWDPVLSHYTSLNDYDRYVMSVSYVGGPAGSDIDLALLLNTGLTGPSGNPSNDATNDTFWVGEWLSLSLGETCTLILDFGGAEAQGISDNKSPHTGGDRGWLDGGIYAINTRDRHEISNLGFQIADFDGDALGSQLTICLNLMVVHVDDDNAGLEDGTAEHPYNTIQEAVAVVPDGGTVKVAQGTYAGDLIVNGKHVTVEGGYEGGTNYPNAGDFSEANRNLDPATNQTVIDAGGAGRQITCQGALARGSVLESFTISNGGASFQAIVLRRVITQGN